MDLITSDGSTSKPSPATSTAPPPIDSASPVPVVAERKSKKGTLMQIQSDTISAAKAAFNPVRANIMPQRQKKKVLFVTLRVSCVLTTADYTSSFPSYLKSTYVVKWDRIWFAWDDVMMNRARVIDLPSIVIAVPLMYAFVVTSSEWDRKLEFYFFKLWISLSNELAYCYKLMHMYFLAELQTFHY